MDPIFDATAQATVEAVATSSMPKHQHDRTTKEKTTETNSATIKATTIFLMGSLSFPVSQPGMVR